MSGHGGGGGKESGVFPIEELVEASAPVWEFLGNLFTLGFLFHINEGHH